MPRLTQRILPLVALALAWPAPAAAQFWTPMSTIGAPTPRDNPSAVWTGSRLIIWGGLEYVNATSNDVDTGALYDPATDTWAPTTRRSAPSPRDGHTAVWTGSRMIVWGGWTEVQGYFNTGGIYDPATDTWTSMTTVGAPPARKEHTAVWTGSRMIVWGGLLGDGGPPTDGGGIYDPGTDTWAPLSPSGIRAVGASAVWTGSRLAVWGGEAYVTDPLRCGGPSACYVLVNTGKLVDPESGLWTTMSTTGAPPARRDHRAVWTGSTMVVVGGTTGATVSSPESFIGAYDPVADSWTPLTTAQAPVLGSGHGLVWTGTNLVVWGGLTLMTWPYTGGIYDPGTNSWTPTSGVAGPTARTRHVALWTGSRMIVWGGTEVLAPPFPVNTGSVYDPAGGVSPPMGFYTVPPCRLTDSRTDFNNLFGTWNGFYGVAGTCQVPATAKAVSLNVTVLPTSESGHLRLYPMGGPVPPSSAINFIAGQARANSTIALLGDDGKVGVHAHQTGAAVLDLILDVNGYFQ